MIGWYIHHVGVGHLHRAEAVARALGCPVTGLSSLPRPARWQGPWLALPRDDGSARDHTAGGQLHWAPLHDQGLRARMAALSAWIEEQDPRLVVSDVSAEVTLLARLHGVPTLSVVLPGDRADPAHVLAYRLSDALVAAWPGTAPCLGAGLPDDLERRIHHVGGLSRSPVARPRGRRPEPRRVTLLGGAGGTTVTPDLLEAARRETPEWTWTVLAPPPLGDWVADPASLLGDSDVVVTHAGQSSVAEVAAARRPAIVIPQPRPHGEQDATARALTSTRWPATVLGTWPRLGWGALLDEASRGDGAAWEGWCDGAAAGRFAAVIEQTVDRLSVREAAG